jgi:hypothetical protein
MIKKIFALAAAALVLVLVGPVVAQNAPTHLDYVEQGPAKQTIPPDGTMWHELVPVFCQQWQQTAYLDNGDGMISICDWMNLTDPNTGAVNGFHIEWVGPTYWLDANGDGTWDPDNDEIYEPTLPYDDVIEVCDMWEMIYPIQEPDWHVTAWEDTDQNGVPNACDWVWLGAIGFHIIDVTVNVRVGPPGDPVVIEQSTWGQIKDLYGE